MYRSPKYWKEMARVRKEHEAKLKREAEWIKLNCGVYTKKNGSSCVVLEKLFIKSYILSANIYSS